MRAVVLAAAPIGSIRDDADQEISAQNAAHADAIRPACAAISDDACRL
jgi:hypothetical protein